MPPLSLVRAGHGPRVVLVHGGATDHTTWTIQLASASLRQRFELITYDREPVATIADGAAEIAAAIAAAGPAPSAAGAPIIVGSSFGAVVALELARTQRAPCAGLVLIEPPMAPTDAQPDFMAAARDAIGGDTPMPSPIGFLDIFDRTVAEAGGPAAGELFLRTVLGEPAFAKIPRAFLERSKARWAEIRADCVALGAYPPRYAALRTLDLPVLLVGGEQSAPYFRHTLDALAAVLPRARLATIPRAGHMLHAEAPFKFAELLTGFADELGLR